MRRCEDGEDKMNKGMTMMGASDEGMTVAGMRGRVRCGEGGA